MRFYAEKVSVSEDGEYFHLSLEATNSLKEGIENNPFDSPYLILQRSFEMPGRGLCYVETHDFDYCGHFRLRLNEFSPSRLAFEIVRSEKKHVEVSLALSAPVFEEVRPIVNVIFGN